MIDRFIDYFQHPGLVPTTAERALPPNSRPFLGELVAPWLLQFSPLNHDWELAADKQADFPRGYPTALWRSLGTDRKNAMLGFVLRNEEAMNFLIGHVEQSVEGLYIGFAEHGASIEEYAALLGLFTQHVVQQQEVDQQEHLNSVNLLFTAIHQLDKVAVMAFPEAAIPLRIIARAVSIVQSWIFENEWFDTASAADVRRDAEHWQEGMFAVAGAAMARAGWDERMSTDHTLAALDLEQPPEPHPRDPQPQVDYEGSCQAWRQRVKESLARKTSTWPEAQQHAAKAALDDALREAEMNRLQFVNPTGAGKSSVGH